MLRAAWFVRLSQPKPCDEHQRPRNTLSIFIAELIRSLDWELPKFDSLITNTNDVDLPVAERILAWISFECTSCTVCRSVSSDRIQNQFIFPKSTDADKSNFRGQTASLLITSRVRIRLKLLCGLPNSEA